ncbi:MAG: DUF4249 family protein [Bacteroidales bacterium]|nr:DUF4249 family protein [Bacteroidales bacterium]
MKKLICLIPVMLLLAMLSCSEDIVIDLEEGSPMIGVEGSFTNEFKRHEVILSYTADFYNTEDIKMVTGAKVAVTDGIDTIPYLEQTDQPGHYLTDSVAGKKCSFYKLLVDVPEENGEVRHLYAESYMGNNVDYIDSLALKQNPVMPGVPMLDTIYMLYPYFMSLFDPTIVYMIHVSQDGVPQNDSLLQVNSIPMAGYAGYYVNGPEMLEKNMEIPVCMISSSELHDGMVIRLDLFSITMDYMMFIYSVKMAMGSNPMMGSPSNVMTNIQPQGEAVGWFYAASVVSKEMVYHKE